MSESYLEPAQAFKMVLYAERVNGIKLLTFYWRRENSILNVWLDFKYVICSGYFQKK